MLISHMTEELTRGNIGKGVIDIFHDVARCELTSLCISLCIMLLPLLLVSWFFHLEDCIYMSYRFCINILMLVRWFDLAMFWANSNLLESSHQLTHDPGEPSSKEVGIL
ncbi:unnamed protein product [Lactuca saligna]|uniref:Uncharacterized protein n=1 Tax=Lactuca saligna TaxID=75948 RepID=A0AA35YSE6_LACSI|nr:unnamed protein product [Lactuca saligna]